MQESDVTLHLIEPGFGVGGAAYLILSVAVMTLSLRSRAPSLFIAAICFALLAFAKLSVFGQDMLRWYNLPHRDVELSAVLHALIPVQAWILLVAALAIAWFAILWCRATKPQSAPIELV